MNEACSNTQKALYTISALTDSEKAHIAECTECQSLQNALQTVDATYMIQERPAPARFAKVLVTHVLERNGNRKKFLNGAAVTGCAVVLILGLRAILPVGSIILGLLVAIGAVVLALKARNYRKWIALGATCCLALIVVSGGVEDPSYRKAASRQVWKMSEIGLANSNFRPSAPGLDAEVFSSDLQNTTRSNLPLSDREEPFAFEANIPQDAQLKAKPFDLQKENQQDKKIIDLYERQVTAIFGKTLNRLTETEQKLDESLHRGENQKDTAAPFAGHGSLNGATALGGAKGLPSPRQPESSIANNRNRIQASRKDARDIEWKSPVAADEIPAPVRRSEGSMNQPASDAIPLEKSEATASNEVAGKVLTTHVGNAIAAFSFGQPAAGQILQTARAYSQHEADLVRRQQALPTKSKKQLTDAISPKHASEKKAYDADKSESDLASDDAVYLRSKSDEARQMAPAITYLDPNGYWENTYLPGSPAIPLLIESLHKTIFPQVAMDQILNTSGVFMVQHPVDPPLQGALGLAAHTDLPYLDKPSRVLLQVTIKGADRARGNRPPLTIVVVIPDSNNIPANEYTLINDTLHALEAERRVDDHIAILTDEAEVPVPFSEFRYGTLELFLKKLQQRNAAEARYGNKETLYRTASSLALGDDGTQLRERIILTIGHSGATSFDPAYTEIDSHVLQGGVASVLALSDNVDLMRLSARGQGSYRVMSASLPAQDQIRLELESYGAVVARALRLNVQLQPGVKLKEIIGSNKLSAPEVEREKAIEVATDQRIAQSLGIEADRGNDDPGIQILIPRFLSGDSHVVILDLFVEQAGPIADISLKSKDLVLMRNETLHASAALPAYRNEVGEINSIIAHNEYAQRLATIIRMVRNYAESGDLQQGVALLQSFAADLETYAPPSNEKSNTTNLINNYVYFLQAMIASSQQGNYSGVREAVTGSLDVTSGKILGNSVRRNK